MRLTSALGAMLWVGIVAWIGGCGGAQAPPREQAKARVQVQTRPKVASLAPKSEPVPSPSVMQAKPEGPEARCPLGQRAELALQDVPDGISIDVRNWNTEGDTLLPGVPDPYEQTDIPSRLEATGQDGVPGETASADGVVPVLAHTQVVEGPEGTTLVFMATQKSDVERLRKYVRSHAMAMRTAGCPLRIEGQVVASNLL